MAKRRQQKKEEEVVQLDIPYEAHVFLDERQIQDAILEVLAIRGYVITEVEIEIDSSREIMARCYGTLPKNVIKQAEDSKQD